MSDLTGDLLFVLSRLADAERGRQSLAEVAAFDGRSPFHVQRVFRKAVGETPLQFQRRVQLQRAAATLLVTDLQVIEVALRAGFDTHEGFTRAFRKRFGVSPSAFRERRDLFQKLVRQNRDHLDVAMSAAPCVGLYRAPLNQPKSAPTRTGDPMSYDVVVKDLTETPFLFVRFQAANSGDEIAKGMGQALGSVFQYATEKGVPFAGPPTSRYPCFGPGLVTIESGLPTAVEAPGEGEITAGQLAGGPAASTIHQGPYDQLSDAHAAVQEWISAENREAAGPPWEVYLTDPGEVPNPADWRTEVVWPLKA